MRLFKKKQQAAATATPDYLRLADMLEHHRINLVFDVGANVGQFAERLRLAGYTGRIVSFEPLQANIDTLTELAAKDIAWEIAPRMAVGEEDGETEINVSQNNDLSSILDIEGVMLEALPKGKYVGKEKVDVRALDSLFDDFAGPEDRVFVKVDTQGYELPVVRGSRKAAEAGRILGWQLELSLVPLYADEPTFDAMTVELGGLGYAPHLIMTGYYSKKLKRQLQVDGVFFRK